MLKTQRVLNYLLLLSLLTFGLGSCSEDLAVTEPIITEESVSDRKACPKCTEEEIVDPLAYAYKLVIETGNWEYTGQDIPTGHQVWDCYNVKTRTWYFENKDDCFCQDLGWNNRWNEDAICIQTKLRCQGGNYVPKDSCSF